MSNREQMNVVIIGHVDHGKSTVIGRLLADTGSLPDGKLESVKEYCRNNARPFEYAFLLDALKDEQAQGITIDTARCFFQTKKRDYIIIDAPGHVEFLKNMVTGASRAEAALLVIDAKEGIRENSKRHGHIASMLGIRQVVILVNKMDLVGFEEDIFNRIRNEFTEFLQSVNIEPLEFIPISAFYGDNIAKRSQNTGWYAGPTVLQQVDGLKNRKSDEELPFRLPVQDIYKFTEQGDVRRIIAGTVLTGKAVVGDEVIFLPSYKKSRIKSIEVFSAAPKSVAAADEAVGFTLDTQIYITQGEIMTKTDEVLPLVGSRFRVNLFWVGKAPFVKGKQYKLKIGTARVPVELAEIVRIIDTTESDVESHKGQVDRHDVAECILETVKPIACDLISSVELNGRFVIVDAYEIAGGGIITGADTFGESVLSSHVKEREFVWEKGSVSLKEREASYGHKAKLLVITTGDEDQRESIKKIGIMLEQKLFLTGCKAYYLGLSNVVHCLASDQADEHEGREEHIRQIGELARLFTDAGKILITSIFDLNDFELEKLKLLNGPNEILVVNVGESPFHEAAADAVVCEDGGVDAVCELLKEREIILEYYI